MIKHRRFFAVITMLFLCFSLLSACTSPKSDEELIESRINNFLKAYNSGDIDAVLDCLDAKTRNTYKAAMNIGNVLIGKTGFGFDLSDLFGLGVGLMSEDDILTISDTTINMVDDTKATVDVTLGYKDKMSDMQEKAFFTMIKEDNDWFIKNLESK